MNRLVPPQSTCGFYRRTIGDLVVTMIVDGSETFSFDILSDNVTAEEAKKLLVAAGHPPLPCMPVNAYVVQDGKRTVLIDSGDGNSMGSGGRLHAELAAANIAAANVDTILLTHAHPDHVGGLAVGGSPLFPNAELILHSAELEFWQSERTIQKAPHLQQVRDLACNTFLAYQDCLRPMGGGEVVPGISLQPLPGHTPGNSGYLIQSGKESVLIWGDIVHWPDIQIPHPEVTLSFDIDPAQMICTRKRLLEQVASENILIGGMHLNSPGFIRIKHDSRSYAIEGERGSAEGYSGPSH